MIATNMNDDNPYAFSNISISKWRQFDRIDIDLHPRLTVLTGANGSGKSTILSILEANLLDGQKGQYLATPEEDKKSKKMFFSFSNLFASIRGAVGNSGASEGQIGKIELKGESATISISLPPPDQIQYQLRFSWQANVKGFKIGSHRALPMYQAIADIPVGGIGPEEAFKFYRHSSSSYELGSRIHRGNTTVSNPLSPLKQTLISFALHGSSNEDVSAVPEIQGLFRGFQETLRNVLPKEIRFRKLNVRSPEVIVETDTGDFPIDGASGGLMSLIQTSWQIFLYSRNSDGKCVVLIDEPENHLHPSLQREFLARLVDAFPEVQFIVATHSPFIICSVKNSFVYALRHKPIETDSSGSQHKAAVTSERIDLNKSVGSASKVLDEVLGVSVTMPIWAEEELAAIVDRFQKEEVDEVAMKTLRNDLEDAGMSELLPQAISRLLS